MRARKELEEVGRRVLNASRTELYLSMRFMGPALGSLGYMMDLSTRTVGTDAVYIRYNPTYLFQSYLEKPLHVNRDYMHMIIHCLFRHMYSSAEHADGQLWDLCADIAAESVIDSMDYPAVARVPSDFREEWYRKLKKELHVLTAEKLYHYFADRKRDYEMEDRLEREFHRDDHSFWQRLPKSENPAEEKPDAGLPDADMPDSRGGKGQNTPQKQEGDTSQKKVSAFPLTTGQLERKRDEWERNAKKLQSELELPGKEASDDTGDLDRVLSLQNRRQIRYRDFLQNFAVYREEPRIDMDSFDYGFYYYGMQRYGNMPLIEENEYRVSRRIDEIVLAIDTSASCQETMVQKFLDETASILMDQENFFHHVHVHIIECDERVQETFFLTDPEEIRELSKHFHIKGGGGTDFRPVFRYVAEEQQKGGMQDLRGLIYFTDGFGKFPDTPTRYETAFVFWSDEDYNDRGVPDWALKLFL